MKGSHTSGATTKASFISKCGNVWMYLVPTCIMVTLRHARPTRLMVRITCDSYGDHVTMHSLFSHTVSARKSGDTGQSVYTVKAKFTCKSNLVIPQEVCFM